VTLVFEGESKDWKQVVDAGCTILLAWPRGSRQVEMTFKKAPALSRTDVDYEVVEVLRDAGGTGKLRAGSRITVAPADISMLVEAHVAYHEEGIGQSWESSNYRASFKPEEGKPVVVLLFELEEKHGLPPWTFAGPGSVEGPALVPELHKRFAKKKDR
jgi:hypothetical protein